MLSAIIITACLFFLAGALVAMWWLSSIDVAAMDEALLDRWSDGVCRDDELAGTSLGQDERGKTSLD